jgi:endoribonuclease Dicer
MRGGDQEDILGGPGSSASSVVAGAATPPSNAILPSVLPLGNFRAKRTRKLEDLTDDQPHKKPRRDRQSVSGSLGNYLPEINNVDKIESLIPPSISVFTEQVLEQAKRENSELGFFLLFLLTYNIL